MTLDAGNNGVFDSFSYFMLLYLEISVCRVFMMRLNCSFLEPNFFCGCLFRFRIVVYGFKCDGFDPCKGLSLFGKSIDGVCR